MAVQNPTQGRGLLGLTDEERAALMRAQAMQPVYGPGAPPPGATPRLGPQGIPQLQRGLAQATAQTVGFGGVGQVGAVPTVTVTPTAGGPRGAGPVITPVATQPVAQSPAVVPPTPKPVDVPAVTSVVPPVPQDATTGAQTLNISGLNELMADRVRTQRAPEPITGARGVFNQATTSQVSPDGQVTSTLRQPENIIEGGYGGFGAGGNQGLSARQYLDRAQAGDDAQRVRDTERRREARADMERIGLREAATRGSATDRAFARRELAAFDARRSGEGLQRIQETGLTERAGIQAQAEQARAGIAGAAAVSAAQAGAAGRQQTAQIAAGATTEAARLRAAGLQGAAQVTASSPQAQLAQQRAQLIQEQLTLAQQAQQAGDIPGTQAALGVRPTEPNVVRDNVTGMPVGTLDASGNFVPYTPEQQARVRRAFLPPQE